MAEVESNAHDGTNVAIPSRGEWPCRAIPDLQPTPIDRRSDVGLRVLDEHRAEALERLCEWIVPGSSQVGPVVYVDAQMAAMARDEREAALEAIDTLAGVDSVNALSAQQRTPEFALLRALAIEAFYSDYVAPDNPGPGAWKEIDFQPPRAADLDRDWSYLEVE